MDYIDIVGHHKLARKDINYFKKIYILIFFLIVLDKNLNIY